MAFNFASSTGVTVTSSTTVTSPSFSVPAGGTVIVASWSFGSGRTATVSGGSLTYTQEATTTATAPSVQLHTAYSASSIGSMTVTSNFGVGTSATNCVWVVEGVLSTDRVGNTDADTATGSTNPFNPTSYTSSVAGSRFIGAVSYDSSNVGSTLSLTSGTNDTAYNSTSTTYFSLSRLDADTATASTAISPSYSISATDGGESGWKLLAIELIPNSQTVSPSSIGSAEAFGTAQLNLALTASGIASGEAFGTATIVYNQAVSPSGIASGEAFGTSQLNLALSLTGIPSEETFGSTIVGGAVGPTGIGSAEAFGFPTVIIQQFIQSLGIASGEAFGTASLQVGYPQTVSLTGIPSAEYFGSLDVVPRSQWVLRTSSVQETPAALDVMNRRYGIHRGISILKTAGGTYVSVRYPSQTEVEEALACYLGGAIYPISSAVRDELVAAGFGSLITLELIA